MAEPIIPGVIRAMAVFESMTGLARDRYVNTFHFIPGANNVTQGDLLDVQAMVADFYTHVHANGHSVGQYLSNAIDHTANKSKVKVYDLGNALPRPVLESTFTVPVKATNSVDLPEEVAVCLSFYADRNIRRHRGRLFLGPVNNATQTTTTPVTVHNDVADTLNLAAQRLIAGGPVATSPRASWVILSKMDLIARSVAHGWVDNTFDTQRRRGARTTSRRSF